MSDSDSNNSGSGSGSGSNSDSNSDKNSDSDKSNENSDSNSESGSESDTVLTTLDDSDAGSDNDNRSDSQSNKKQKNKTKKSSESDKQNKNQSNEKRIENIMMNNFGNLLDNTNNEKQMPLINKKTESRDIKPLIKINTEGYKKLKGMLYNYQIAHMRNTVYSVSKYGRCLNASETGTGKTIITIISCRLLRLRPFIVCPLGVVNSWKEALKATKCKHYGVSNYESILNCRFYPPKSDDVVKCKYLSKTIITDSESDNEKNSEKFEDMIDAKKKELANGSSKKKQKREYVWKLPKDAILIFDEAHRCKNSKTYTSQLLQNASMQDHKIILLSATLADKGKLFLTAGLCLGLYKNIQEGNAWLKALKKEYGNNILEGIHKAIYPELATRIRIKDLGDAFPKFQNIAECIDLDSAKCKEMNEEYKLLEQAIGALKNKEDDDNKNALAKMIHARMRIELCRIPSIVEKTNQLIDEGYSVAIFVNYKNTLLTLSKELNTDCVIYGDQTKDQRSENKDRYQKDKSRVIIVNIQSGGVGISLNDIRGKYPRRALICPTPSGQDFLQVLGRSVRANSKSETIQWVLFAKGTVEENVCSNLKSKIENIGNLNDGDKTSHNIDGFEKIKSKNDDSKSKKNKNDIKSTDSTNKNDGDDKISLTHQKIALLNIQKQKLEAKIKPINDEISSLSSELNSILSNNT